MKNRKPAEASAIRTWAMFCLDIGKLVEESPGTHRHSPIRFTDGKQWFKATSVACGPVEGEIMVCLEETPARVEVPFPLPKCTNPDCPIGCPDACAWMGASSTGLEASEASSHTVQNLPATSALIGPDNWVCRHCGASVADWAQLCPACGMKRS